MAALVAVLVLCLGGLTAMSMHIRCVDAAREAARLAARGGDGAQVARGIAPDGAAVQLRREGELVVATVTVSSALLPGLTLAGRAVAAVEPGVA
ncbi:TadE family type IV pilus minor pilin [Mycobacterium deserti]|uniref:Pilus biosynthesis protein TadE n=1 Tax=Mycobacterium deserti TaxID=2978347 RepID=A0ABT2MHJ9_9MYCO|nr:TadE family type IV pilus minor pilin [Mycobacterium deserti]MCT7661758.1 pilus biosynthesis protein TadE [Mycobacterium deserti]